MNKKTKEEILNMSIKEKIQRDWKQIKEKKEKIKIPF